jgi:hypothetical protein
MSAALARGSILALAVPKMSSNPIKVEVVDTRPLPRDLVALRRFAFLMDEAVEVPWTGRRIGIDALLGLIPGVGDAIGALLSTWVIVAALRHRVPMRKIARMAGNILLDLGVGSIPILGDIFDFLFEENVYNVDLLLRHRRPDRKPRSLVAMMAVVLVVLLALIAVGIFVIALVVVAINRMMGRS